MNSHEINKIAGAILAAMLTAVAAGQLAGALINPHDLEKNVYTVGGADEMADEAAADDDADPAGSTLLLLVDADPVAGEKAAKKCTSCHSFDDGGPNKVGPNLWNIVGAPVAKVEGYDFSAALVDTGGEWTYNRLDRYLTNPKAFAPGTKMSFGGIKKVKDRINLIAWMRQQSLTPATLPADEAKAETEAVATDAAPAMEAAPAAEEAPAVEGAVAEEAPAPAAEETPAAEEAAPMEEAAPAETPAEATEQAAATEGSQLAALFAGADSAAGAKLARKCTACHNAEAGAGNKVGPNLWNIVGAPVAGIEGFKYSAALTEFGGNWTYDRLYAFLEKPKAAVPGTKMSFAGFKKPQQLIDLLAWLGEQSDNPVAPPQ
jgi:cytochrome c